jgi:tetratricopeptide (TPR) repeat protein
LFEYDDLTPIVLDSPEVAPAWRVLGPGRSKSRFEALRTRDLARLVGREEETELLARRWRRAKAGAGQVVLIGGEAGIGKSRLMAALLEEVGAEAFTVLRYGCSPHHVGSALYPIIQQLEWAARLAPDDGASARREKLEALLAETATPAEDAGVLAELLSIEPHGSLPVPHLSPRERRGRTLDALMRQLEALAARGPVIASFEDVHWIDPTSLDLLSRTVERVVNMRVLLVVSFRLEFAPPWLGEPHVSVLTLNRLTASAARELLKQTAGSEELSDGLVAEIIARGDGVPLFLEELANAVVEAAHMGTGPAQVVEAAAAPPAVPATLQASLMARLDRLGTAKEVARIASAIGREFTYELLAAVSDHDEPELTEALKALKASGLVKAEGSASHARFAFKHALVQDAAYGTLLREARRGLHARIAGTLEACFPQTVDTDPEILAHHCFQAGQLEAAVAWWAKAGERASRRSAFEEATAHLRRAIEIADALAQEAGTATSTQARFRLQTAYGQALLFTRGFIAPETTAAFARARELAAGVEDASERFTAYYGLWVGSMIRGELTPARELAGTIVSDADGRPGSAELAAAQRALGTSLFFAGDFSGARVQLEQAVASGRASAELDPDAAFRFGLDPSTAAMVYLAFAHWHLGDIERARSLAEQATARALEIKHVPTLVYVLDHVSSLETMRRDAGRAQPPAATAISLCREHGLTHYLGYVTIFDLWARSKLGELDGGPVQIRGVVDQLRDRGMKVALPQALALLADTELDAGDIEAGLASIDAALAEAQQTSERWNDAECHRIRGQLLLRRIPADVDQAAHAFRTALAIAQRQQARSYALRAALSLAELYQAAARNADACAVLSPALQGFRPTPELPEIEQAQSLLATLTGIDGRQHAAHRSQT